MKGETKAQVETTRSGMTAIKDRMIELEYKVNKFNLKQTNAQPEIFTRKNRETMEIESFIINWQGFGSSTIDETSEFHDNLGTAIIMARKFTAELVEIKHEVKE